MLVGATLASRWLMTQDADLAVARLAADPMDGAPRLVDILKGVDPTFVPRLHPEYKYPVQFRSSSLFAVDVLTTQGRNDRPVLIKGLDCGAQPLKYLDYLIEDAIEVTALIRSGVRARVPQPARFALHKLVVAQMRAATSPKIAKDVAQAKDIIEALNHRNPAIMEDAIEDVTLRGPAWRRLIRDGMRLLDTKA